MLMATETKNHPPTEVSSKAKRRRFTAKYKAQILREVDACKGSGEVSALLRREGLYSSYLTNWRAARRRGELSGLSPQKRGRKSMPKDERDELIRKMKKEIKHLTTRAERAELVVEIQKKVSLMLGMEQPGLED
jgi:transposase